MEYNQNKRLLGRMCIFETPQSEYRSLCIKPGGLQWGHMCIPPRMTRGLRSRVTGASCRLEYKSLKWEGRYICAIPYIGAEAIVMWVEGAGFRNEGVDQG